MQMDKLNLSFEFLANATNGRWINCANTTAAVSNITTDTREQCPNGLFIALSGENFDGHNFLENAEKSGVAAFCVEEERYKKELNKNNLPALIVKDTLKALQDIAKTYRQSLKNLTLIGITGSNGKTSTKEILSQVLAQEFGEDKVYATKANTNNHIGVPLNILQLTQNHRYAVIELGTNHPGEIKVLTDIARPNIAVITSIGASHLEFLKTIYGVAEEKSSIFNYFDSSADSKNLAIIPNELFKYKIIREKLYNKNILTFAEVGHAKASLHYKELASSIEGSVFNIAWQNPSKSETVKWTVHGKHQMGNAAITALVATHLGVDSSSIAKHLGNCHLTGMRMKIRKSGNTTIINDAYNANPTSTKAGLVWLSGVLPKSFHDKHFIVLGDMLELGEEAPAFHSEVLQTYLSLMPDCKLITVGKLMQQSAASLKTHKNIISFTDSSLGAEYIGENIKNIDIIYLKGSRGTKLEIIDQAFS